MAVPDKVKELVETFDNNIRAYHTSEYKEAQLRNEFINPFFIELGWDVNNEKGYSPTYREVIHEYTLRKSGERPKSPDYAFRVGDKCKFFLEVKKPSIDIKEDSTREEPTSSFQLRRYAWSIKLPLSLLTNFEELSVYNCQIRPLKNDKASTARVSLYNYCDYESKWDEIKSIFSREAVLKGYFDNYAESVKDKKGTSEVDVSFLKEIESWRDFLARNIAIRNPRLSQHDMNYAVQSTIDRIIFLRVCEDRGIDKYERLKKLLDGDGVYQRLMQVFYEADDRYNSGLFHFRQEKDRSSKRDDLTPDLTIDDKPLKDIIDNIYSPNSPFEFSVIPVHILGQVYEQFLGKVIRLTASHHAKVEEKPEVKKAGGVYYTPTYIVDYIVENTVGKLLNGNTPRRVSKLKILDPACGSGSFLIGAYQRLLDWHRDWYVSDGAEKYKKEIYEGQGGWKLTTTEKKRILLNNIFGVDIDTQAVEVTKLSLLLKVLEGESEETITSQLRMFKERALPDLGDNIKCGNSLIGPDFYEGVQMLLLDEEERYRINVFDWKGQFSEIMDAGGFDVVIGNPPYVRIQNMKEWAPLEVEFYKKVYKSASKGNYDIYVVFIEQGLSLLNNKGIFGFILPNKFFNAKYGSPIRELISRENHLSQIVHFGAYQVFSGATTYTCLLFLEKSGKNDFEFIKVNDIEKWKNGGGAVKGKIASNSLTSMEWNFVVGEDRSLFLKLGGMPLKLGDISDIFVGLQTSADDVFIMDFIDEDENTIKLKSKSIQKKWIFEKGLLFPLISGTDVIRYSQLPERQYILFPYDLADENVPLIDFKTISEKYPNTASYLLENRKVLEGREKSKFKGHGWYRFGRSQNIGIQNKSKICVPRLVESLYAAYDGEGSHFLDNVDVGGIILKETYSELGYKYILGLLNSKLLRWYFPFVSATFRGGWLSANRQFLSQLPIRVIDFENSFNKLQHNKLVSLVDNMLELHKKLNNAKSPHDKTIIQRQIDATDKNIDKLVYELYELTDDEIRIIEEDSKEES